ncbi:MAG TPA: sigma-70 family RNA polymerase sigma factor [Polyangiales bacterium]
MTLLSGFAANRQQFMELVAAIRPELHRYCARMTGSIADGEDVVQDTLARAYFALAELETLPPLRPWLFRIAHRRALDHLRRYERRMSEPLHDTGAESIDQVERVQAVTVAFSQFLSLPAQQRSAVILKDVLDHSLDDIASLLDLSVPAVKAALHRGRARLRAGTEPDAVEITPETVRYAQLFNARAWDDLRALLAEDVELELITRARRRGRAEVAGYFGNYALVDDWYLVPDALEGREVLAVYRDRSAARPSYFIVLDWQAGLLRTIVDYRYVPYIADEAAFQGAR